MDTAGHRARSPYMTRASTASAFEYQQTRFPTNNKSVSAGIEHHGWEMEGARLHGGTKHQPSKVSLPGVHRTVFLYSYSAVGVCVEASDTVQLGHFSL